MVNATRQAVAMPRRFRTKNAAPAASTVVGKNGHPLLRTTPACAPADIVNVVVVALPDGVMVIGLKKQVTSEGSPEHAKVTDELNPF
jgi:hypothetical protein